MDLSSWGNNYTHNYSGGTFNTNATGHGNVVQSDMLVGLSQEQKELLVDGLAKHKSMEKTDDIDMLIRELEKSDTEEIDGSDQASKVNVGVQESIFSDFFGTPHSSPVFIILVVVCVIGIGAFTLL